jgi:tetratricopeptide (TPR) repeat protein
LVDRSPALPLLAIRAARRAVADNPEDSNAWLRLGQAYLSLRNETWEHSREEFLPPLAALRYVQIATALEEAVRLDPNLESAHHELAALYGGRNFIDQALEHQREEVRLSKRAGARPGETADELADRFEFLDKDLAKIEELVQFRHQQFAAAARTLKGGPVAQAQLALRFGLGRHALEGILLSTPGDLLGETGLKLQLDLLLSLGRTQEVRSILQDEETRVNKQGLKYYDVPPQRNENGIALYSFPYHWPTYEWLHLLQAAAMGDYADARGDLRTIRSGLHNAHAQLEQRLKQTEGGEWLLLTGLWSGPPPFVPAFMTLSLAAFLEDRTSLQNGEPVLRAQQADLLVLEALLALEQGDAPTALSAFLGAQELCTKAPNSPTPFAGAPIAARYLERLWTHK